MAGESTFLNLVEQVEIPRQGQVLEDLRYSLVVLGCKGGKDLVCLVGKELPQEQKYQQADDAELLVHIFTPLTYRFGSK